MGNTMTLKHGASVPTTSDLEPFELGYCTADGALYINDGSQIKSIFQSNGAISTVLGSNLTASRALVSDGNGKIAVSAVTSTELGYLDGVTSAIQTQLSNRYDSTTSRTKNTVLAAPNGSNGAATFRSLELADLPTVTVAKGGTGATDAATARTNLGITVENIGAAPTVHNHKKDSLNPAAIEFTGATGHGGYIDFHYASSTDDYTSRIIESQSGVVTLNDSPIVTPAAPNGFHYLGVKTSLPSGANFNTYITPGQWATNTYDTANTFSNCPYVTAGSLTVYYSDTTTNEIHQIWESRDYKVYERYSNNGGTTWSAWNKRLTSANVVAVYNTAVTFTDGKATYPNSAITSSSICIVQRRVGTAGASNVFAFGTTSNNGNVTICAPNTSSVSMNLNIIIINP